MSNKIIKIAGIVCIVYNEVSSAIMLYAMFEEFFQEKIDYSKNKLGWKIAKFSVPTILAGIWTGFWVLFGYFLGKIIKSKLFIGKDSRKF